MEAALAGLPSKRSQAKLKRVRKSGAPASGRENEIPKRNDDILSTLPETYPALPIDIQERQGARVVMGRETAGREEERLWWSEIPRTHPNCEDHQAADSQAQVQRVQ